MKGITDKERALLDKAYVIAAKIRDEQEREMALCELSTHISMEKVNEHDAYYRGAREILYIMMKKGKIRLHKEQMVNDAYLKLITKDHRSVEKFLSGDYGIDVMKVIRNRAGEILDCTAYFYKKQK